MLIANDNLSILSLVWTPSAPINENVNQPFYWKQVVVGSRQSQLSSVVQSPHCRMLFMKHMYSKSIYSMLPLMLAVVQIVSNLCFCQPDCLATNWTAILSTWLVFTIYGPFEVWLCVSNSHLLRTNEAAVSIWPSIKERFVYLLGMFGGDHRITGFGYWNVLLPLKIYIYIFQSIF